ncbi:hypothetical protein [Streptomyces sp. NPDC005148]
MPKTSLRPAADVGEGVNRVVGTDGIPVATSLGLDHPCRYFWAHRRENLPVVDAD